MIKTKYYYYLLDLTTYFFYLLTLTYPPTYLPTNIQTYHLHTYLPTYPLTHLPTGKATGSTLKYATYILHNILVYLYVFLFLLFSPLAHYF